MATPRVAGSYSFQRHPATFEGAIFLNGFKPVGAASGRVAAAHTQQRRDGTLIEADETDEQYGKQTFHEFSFAAAVPSFLMPVATELHTVV